MLGYSRLLKEKWGSFCNLKMLLDTFLTFAGVHREILTSLQKPTSQDLGSTEHSLRNAALHKEILSLTTVMNLPNIHSSTLNRPVLQDFPSEMYFLPHFCIFLTHFFTSLCHLPLFTFSLNPSEQLQGSTRISFIQH